MITYAYQAASIAHLAYKLMLELERRRLEEAELAADAYVAASGQEALQLLGLSLKAEAQLARPRGSPGGSHARLLTIGAPTWRHARTGRRRPGSRACEWRSRGGATLAVCVAAELAGRTSQRALGRRAPARSLRKARRECGEAARRLGMRFQLARTQREVGLRLRDGPGAERSFLGLAPAACLAEARRSFEALGLGWELERMESLELS